MKVEIYHITIQNSELYEGNVYIRRKHLDALLDTNEGIINLEVNSTVNNYLKIRNYAFLSRVFVNNTLRGDHYNVDQKYIQINFSYELTDNEYMRVYSIQDNSGRKFIPNIKIYEFNMDKYVNTWYTNDEEKIMENKYLIMMDLPKEELEKFSKKDKVVREYMERLIDINNDPAFLNLIDYEEDSIRMENAMKDEAMREGKTQGIAEGRTQGIAEGRTQGIAEGRTEGLLDGKIMVAKNLIKYGMSLDDVSKNTGLSIDDIKLL